MTKDFGPVHAVRGIDLELQQGEIVAFLGPNGAGKTTTIDMVLGLSRPTSGTAQVLGLAPRHAIARGLVSAVMQTGGLLKDLTVRETVRYTASLFADTRPVGEVLGNAGITAIADRKVAKCSGGEQQRLRFAMALLSDPHCCCSTSRRPAWTSRVAVPSGRRSAPTPSGPHDPLRHALPRGGRPVRRPDRAHQPRPDRRRRHRRPDQGARLGTHGPGHLPAPTPAPWPRSTA